jgi:hypothetical protein
VFVSGAVPVLEPVMAAPLEQFARRIRARRQSCFAARPPVVAHEEGFIVCSWACHSAPAVFVLFTWDQPERAPRREDTDMMNIRKTTATIGVTALMAVPAATLMASPASAAEKSGKCGGARFELSVEKDDGRFEVEADIENAKPGSKWRVILKHDGKRFYNKVRKADREGDIEVERNRRNTAGKDVFRLTVKRVGTKTACTRTITLR